MGPVLDGLVKLQSVENRLRVEKAKLARCRRNVVIQENLIRSLQNALEAKNEEVQLTKVQFDRLELELKSRDATISKLRASLNTARTNKEYAAVLTQLNTTKADNSKIEAQSLDLLRDMEVDEAECKDIHAAQPFDVREHVAPHVPIQAGANDPHAATSEFLANFDNRVVKEVDFVDGHHLGVADAVEDRSGVVDGLGGGGLAVVCDDVCR